MSTEHDVVVVRLGPVVKHPDADTLGITEVDGRPCIVRLGEFNEGDMAVYIPIDATVPVNREPFLFLASQAKDRYKRLIGMDVVPCARIKAMRLRGVFSMGLVVKATPDMVEGEILNDRWNVGTYEDPEPLDACGRAIAANDPGILPGKYDIESLRKHHRLFEMGEEVVITEKIDGENSRFVYHDGRLHVGSRTMFKKPPESGKYEDACQWWRLAIRYDLEAKLRDVFPHIAIYGEEYGRVGGMRYGQTDANLVVFDVLNWATREWFDFDTLDVFCRGLGLPQPPVLYRGPWQGFDHAKQFAEGESVLAAQFGSKQIREGFVIRPVKERSNPRLPMGRLLLKLHGEGYLLHKGKKA